MGQYSIKDLEQLSGIKAHTIRIWEKRHRLIEPKRTTTNIRYYSDEDLKKILNVSVLNAHGLKISKILNLSTEELSSRVVELSKESDSVEIFIEQLVIAMVDMEEEQFERLLSQIILKMGFERTILEVVYPFLEKIGVLWLTDNISPSQEHFISNLIRQKLIVAIDGVPLASKQARRAILFLPENELHELALLFHYYLTKNAGIRTYYLGQSVPYNDVKKVFAEHKPDLIITSFTTQPKEKSVQAYAEKMSADFPDCKILITGYNARKIKTETLSNVSLFNNALMLKGLLNS